MIVIKGIVVADASLTSSNVAEPFAGEALWVAATAYTLGQEVIRLNTHRKYKNILAGSDAGVPESTPLRWTESGVTNRYAMFDQLRSTQTSVTSSPLVVTVTPGIRTNAISLLNLAADSATISVMQGGVEVYTFTQDLRTRVVNNYYEYCYAEFTRLAAIVKFDIPPATNSIITITLTSGNGVVKCGGLVIGTQTYLGQLQYGAKISALNFSRIDRAFDGTATLTPRPAKPTISGQLFSASNITDKVLKIKSELDAVPAVWSGLDDRNTDPRFAGLLISGIFRQLEPRFDYYTSNLVDIELEEI